MKIHLIDGTYELFRAHFGAPSATAPEVVKAPRQDEVLTAIRLINLRFSPAKRGAFAAEY